MIGKKVINTATSLVQGLLVDYQGKIDEAYVRSDGELKIGLSLKLQPGANGGILMEAGISFINEKTTDKVKMHVDEDQGELFAKDEENNE